MPRKNRENKMSVERMQLGFRGTRADGDMNAPLLEEELNDFKEKVDTGFESSRIFDRYFFSCVTPHGKQMIKEALAFRIMNDDLPMTYLWRHPGNYTTDSWDMPVYQADGISEPVEGQRGGWAFHSYDDEKITLVKIPGYVSYRSYRRKLDENGKKVMLKIGEPISNGEFAPLGGPITPFDGHFTVNPHYEKKEYGINDFPGDVKSAILASCMWPEDKQELLDLFYSWNDPLFQKDSYFCKMIRRFRKGESVDPMALRKDIENCSDLNERVRENLLLNLDNSLN